MLRSLHDFIVQNVLHPCNRRPEYRRLSISRTRGYIAIHPITARSPKLNQKVVQII